MMLSRPKPPPEGDELAEGEALDGTAWEHYYSHTLPEWTLQKLAQRAAFDYQDAPSILVPIIGGSYFISLWSAGYTVHFHATLQSYYAESEKWIDFEFDNGVGISGLPDLLPDGWEISDADHFVFSRSRRTELPPPAQGEPQLRLGEAAVHNLYHPCILG